MQNQTMTPKTAPSPAAGRFRPGTRDGMAGRLDRRSAAAATLQRLGLVNGSDLDGGFTAWTAAGLPVTRAGSG
jgi:hypothetical protein